LDPFDPWFATIPAVLQSAGVDEQTNSVFARISSANPDAQRLIEEHFGWQGMLTLESDGTGALLLPKGTLVLRVVDERGRPQAGLQCAAVPDMPGAYESPLDAPQTDADGKCRLELPATGYWVRLQRMDEEGTAPVGQGRAVVQAGVVSEATITIEP
jgi:hypothetical protein